MNHWGCKDLRAQFFFLSGKFFGGALERLGECR